MGTGFGKKGRASLINTKENMLMIRNQAMVSLLGLEVMCIKGTILRI
jgi:hypothetical protein